VDITYALPPEIEVSSSEGGALTDGGTDNQGLKNAGVSNTVTYTIVNSGTDTLTLTGSIGLTNLTGINGTPTVSAYTSSSLAVNASATFTVAYTPDCSVSSFSFDLSIANNDLDENPFNFTVTGTTRDLTAPVTPTLSPLSGTAPYTIPLATTTDNCSGSITGSTTLLTFTSVGTYEVIWTFRDTEGNISTATQTVVVSQVTSGGGGSPSPEPEEDPCENDTTSPIAPVLSSITDVCRITLEVPTATDDCSGTISGTTTSPLTYDQVGSYTVTWTFTDTASNSSTAVQQVNIDYDQELTDTQEACDSFEWIDGVVYTQDNTTATFEITNAEGCTTLHRLDLTVYPLPDTTVRVEGNTISAVQAGAQYQWIDCENGNTPIAGAMEQSFTPTGIKGSYAVQITTAWGCTLTSDCIAYSDATTVLAAEGISSNGDGVNDTWRIQNIEKYPQAKVYVYNRLGREVYRALNGYNNDWRGTFESNADLLPSGPYFYTIDLENDGKVDMQGWLYIQD